MTLLVRTLMHDQPSRCFPDASRSESAGVLLVLESETLVAGAATVAGRRSSDPGGERAGDPAAQAAGSRPPDSQG